MTDNETKFLEIIEEVLEVSKGSINLEQKKEDIEEWSSLKNLMIYLKLEETYNMKFATTDITDLVTLREIFDRIMSKVAS